MWYLCLLTLAWDVIEDLNFDIFIKAKLVYIFSPGNNLSGLSNTRVICPKDQNSELKMKLLLFLPKEGWLDKVIGYKLKLVI